MLKPDLALSMEDLYALAAARSRNIAEQAIGLAGGYKPMEASRVAMLERETRRMLEIVEAIKHEMEAGAIEEASDD